MKKHAIAAAFVVTLALGSAGVAFAAPAGTGVSFGEKNTCPRNNAPVCQTVRTTCTSWTNGIRFIDLDQDGVCDNWGGGRNCPGGGFVDADNDGTCDNARAYCGHDARMGAGNGQGAGACGQGGRAR